jgi:hypothetical protein
MPLARRPETMKRAEGAVSSTQQGATRMERQGGLGAGPGSGPKRARVPARRLRRAASPGGGAFRL